MMTYDVKTSAIHSFYSPIPKRVDYTSSSSREKSLVCRTMFYLVTFTNSKNKCESLQLTSALLMMHGTR